MIEVIVFSIYIAVFSLCIGIFVRKMGGRFLNLPEPDITKLIITGVVSITAITGWYSVFFPIGGVYHILMLAAAVSGAVYCRHDLKKILSGIKLDSADAVCAILVVLIISYAASRGGFHTDTGIYHAAAIRQYEEYGVLKGAANLQPHYGYNSSYIGLCAFFTMSFILESPLHITTAFLMMVLSLDAVFNLKHFKKHRNHYADASRVVTLLYIMMNYTGTISPATDYGTMLLTSYFITCWAETTGGDTYTDEWGVLSVFGLFLVTMKLSAAMCVIVAALPIWAYIKTRSGKKIMYFIVLGLAGFGFYPVRNVIISGWLFYPFEAIDLFDVEWKLPREYSLIDSNQIKVWAKCLFDVEKIDYPLSKWLPIWWEAQEHYDQMIVYACLVGFLLILLTIIIRRRFFGPAEMMLYIMCIANLAVWFFTAPFIRYGLIFLMTLPVLSLMGFYDAVKSRGTETEDIKRNGGVMRVMGWILSTAITVCFFARIDHYVMDDLVFIKHEAGAPYYIKARPFDEPSMAAVSMGENGSIVVYYPEDGSENNSYFTPPSACYKHILDRCEPMGECVEDGFRSRRIE